MSTQGKRRVFVGIGILSVLIFSGFYVAYAQATDSIVGQWNYATSKHWSKGPVPTGNPSTGIIAITQNGDQLKMEVKSGMVFNPPDLKHFIGRKNDQEYVFSNRAIVDNEGGVAENTFSLKKTGTDQYAGKAFSQYSNGEITFYWGFNITLTR